MIGLRFLSGEAAARERIEAWLDGSLAGDTLRDGKRRRIVRLPARSDDEAPILVKHFRSPRGRHALRERLTAARGRSPAEREARHLRPLERAGASRIAPLAEARLADGDRLLALPFVEGRSLDHWLDEPDPGASRGPGKARDVLVALGRRVAALHAAGIGHGDLHAGNVLVGPEGCDVLDLQHAGRLSRRQRFRDLGDLDFSLWGRASLADRVRLRAEALGHSRPFDLAAREELRLVGREAERRAFEHGERRTRRALQPGRVNEALALPGRRGLRVPEIDDDAVGQALAAHDEAVLDPDERLVKSDERSCLTRVAVGARHVVVKEVLPRGPARIVADLVRGSAARRAFQAGHGLLARGIGAARPLAFAEERRLGLPVASWLLLESIDDPDALACCERDPASVVEPLLDLLDRLHRRGAHHGDLKSTHVFLDGQGHARLIDLEGVRFRRRLDEDDRMEALAQLNASLPDVLPSSLRRAAFARYAARHPFAGGTEVALREVVRRSLAREHRWSGADCALEPEGERVDGIL